MKVMSRVDPETSRTYINIVLTEDEVKRLVDGKVVSVEDPHLVVQIVGYGQEEENV